MPERKLGVGLYGFNGHQIHNLCLNHPRVALRAIAGVVDEKIPEILRGQPIKICASLEDMLQEPDIELVSLCSPRRREQAHHAIACLRAGKHVYAEKPCAMSESDLDAILAAAEASGCRFHEMAGTAFEEPYFAMREVVASGRLGEIVQVFAQKSYPYHDARPQDEDIDGGLTLQVGIHGARLIEHITGLQITDVASMETQVGNPRVGNLKMAVSCIFRLANSSVASLIANYCGSEAIGVWGNDHLRIFGSRGFVESVDGGQRTRLVLEHKDYGSLPSGRRLDWFSAVVSEILDGTPMPLTLENELHPLRVMIRASRQMHAPPSFY